MLNRKMKKVASVLSISALLGTTIVTPLGVLSSNAALAQAAVATTPSADASTTNPNLLGDFSVYALPTTMGDTYRFNNYVFGSTPASMGPSQQITQKISTQNTLTKVAGQTDTFTIGQNNLKEITLLGADKNGISIDNKAGDAQQQLAIGFVGTLVPGKEYSFSFSTTFDKPGKEAYGNRYIGVSSVYGSEGSGASTIGTSAGSAITSSGNITGTFKAGQGADKYSNIALNVYTPTGAVITISDFTLTKSPAQEQADLQSAAQTAVNNLFTGGNTANDIKAGLTQDEIDNAKNLVSQLPDSTLKDTLTNAVNKAQTQLDQQNDTAAYNAARAAVNDLFANKDTSGAIKSGLTQADIDAAKVLANKVVDPTKKAELQKDLNNAQQQLDASNAAAAEQARQAAAASIQDLFNNNDTAGTIKDATNQAAIDAAQKKVDVVTDPTKKAELQKELNEAQTQLNARNAAEAAADASVKGLFNNNDTTGTIKDATDQAAINAAQKTVNAVTNPAKKAALQKDLDEAQRQLNDKITKDKAQQTLATYLVNQLFKDANPSTDTLNTGVTQTTIDNAKAEVNKVQDATVKADLMAKVNRAQELFNIQNTTKGTISPVAYTPGSTVITGVFTGDVTRATLTVNGKYVSTGGTFSNGVFSYYVGSTIKSGDTVTLTAFDKDGKQLDQKTVQVIKLTSGSITLNQYNLGSTTFTGTYTGDVTQMNLLVNGKSVSWGGTFNPNGTFSYYVGSAIKAGDTVTFVAYDKDGKQLDQKTLSLASTTGVITPAVYTPGDTSITGIYAGDVAQASLTINGAVVSWGGTFNSNGTFSYYVGAKIKAGDTVVLTAYDKNGKQLDQKTVSQQAFTGSITPVSYSLGNTNITGTYTGDVAQASLTVDGKIVSWGGTFNSNGTFSYYAGSAIKATSNVTITIYDKTGKVIGSKAVNVVAFSGSITPAPYTVGNANITGTYTGPVAKARLTVDGTVVSWGGTFNADGSFTYYVGNKITAGSNAVIDIFASDGSLLGSKQIDVK